VPSRGSPDYQQAEPFGVDSSQRAEDSMGSMPGKAVIPKSLVKPMKVIKKKKPAENVLTIEEEKGLNPQIRARKESNEEVESLMTGQPEKAPRSVLKLNANTIMKPNPKASAGPKNMIDFGKKVKEQEGSRIEEGRPGSKQKAKAGKEDDDDYEDDDYEKDEGFEDAEEGDDRNPYDILRKRINKENEKAKTHQAAN